MSITLTVLFNTFNQSLTHSAELFEQNRLIWVAESLLEKIKTSSFNDISHCLSWKQAAHEINKKDHPDYCYYVMGEDNHYYIDIKPNHSSKFFSFLVQANPVSFNKSLNVFQLENKSPFTALKLQLQIEYQQKKIILTGFKWVKNNASF